MKFEILFIMEKHRLFGSIFFIIECIFNNLKYYTIKKKEMSIEITLFILEFENII